MRRPSPVHVATDRPMRPAETLLFLDEIQACPRALTSLKYFAEQLPEVHVVAAGSLLGVELSRAASFPVVGMALHP